MKKLSGIIALLLLPCCYSYAHVGSPDVVMQGYAGRYKLLVNVKPPDVIPGIATVTVYVESGSSSSALARAIYFYAGESGAPPAEQMSAVPGQVGQYTSKIWLMSGGSSGIQVTINGNEGKGQMVVPVVAISTANRTMPSSTGWILAALGVFLFVLMVTMIGSGVSDALTKAGEPISQSGKRKRIVGIAVATVLTSLAVYGGNAWWQSWATDYKRFLFRPVAVTSTIEHKNGVAELRLALDTASEDRSSFSYIVPDHGKLMHMFIMRLPGMDAFAHLHPLRLDSAHFSAVLPPLPKGKYLAFADIVFLSGFTETIRDTVDITSAVSDSLHMADADDAYAFALPLHTATPEQLPAAKNVIVPGKPGMGVKLQDGSVMTWEDTANAPPESGRLYQLKFRVRDPDNKPARLESYLGMAGHAAIVRDDGNVYIHIHPVGTYSMTAENSLNKRIAGPKGIYHRPEAVHFRDSIDRFEKYLRSLSSGERENLLMQQMGMPMDMGHGMEKMDYGDVVEFPYSFPSPGTYRIWIQVKRNGEVLTGAFDRVVK